MYAYYANAYSSFELMTQDVPRVNFASFRALERSNPRACLDLDPLDADTGKMICEPRYDAKGFVPPLISLVDAYIGLVIDSASG